MSEDPEVHYLSWNVPQTTNVMEQGEMYFEHR